MVQRFPRPCRPCPLTKHLSNLFYLGGCHQEENWIRTSRCREVTKTTGLEELRAFVEPLSSFRLVIKKTCGNPAL